MGYNLIPKLPRNKYNYIGPSYSVSSAPNALLKAANASGGNSGGTVITNTTLAAMSKVVQQYVDEKGFLTPTDVKTVNGVSIVGTGDIEVTAEGVVDLSAYVTKVELENAGYLTTVPDNYATKAYVQEEINKIPQADLSSYVTKTELEQAGYLTTVPDNYVQDAQLQQTLAAYATKTYVEAKISEIPQADLSSYVTKTELEQAGYLTTVPDNYATKTYVATKAQEIISNGSYISSNELSGMGYVTTSEISQASYVTSNALETELQDYATKTYVQSEISKIPQSEIDLSSYVTKTELEQAGYATQYQLDQAGYLTTVPDNYATKTYVATKAQEIISSGSYISSNELSGMGYVTTSEISQASYVTANALETKLQSYVTKQELDTTLDSYVTETMLEEGLTKYVEKNTFDAAMENVVSTSTADTTLTTYTASQSTGIIVLKHANATLDLPTTGIIDGKTVTVINKTGGSFTIHTNGNFIDKETTQRDPQTRVVSSYAMQFVYYDGEWYIMQ